MSHATSMLMRMGYSIYWKVRDRIARDCGMRCSYCGVEIIIGLRAGERLATIDHKIPLSRGGSWKRYNLTCACKGCNQEKGDMTPEEFAEWREKLGWPWLVRLVESRVRSVGWGPW